MGWKLKGNPCKIRGIPLGWESRKKLGIIPEEEEDFLQRNSLPSFERHPNHWGFPPKSSPLDYLSLAHKPPYTSESLHNMTIEQRNTLQGHISKRPEGPKVVQSWPFTLREARTGKVIKDQPKVKFAKNTPPSSCSFRDTQHYSQ